MNEAMKIERTDYLNAGFIGNAGSRYNQQLVQRGATPPVPNFYSLKTDRPYMVGLRVRIPYYAPDYSTGQMIIAGYSDYDWASSVVAPISDVPYQWNSI